VRVEPSALFDAEGQMANQAAAPSDEVRRIVRATAGKAIIHEVNEITARLKQQSNVPPDAWLLIKRWRWLAFKLAEEVLRRDRSGHHGDVTAGRSGGSFVRGFISGGLVSLIVYLLIDQPWT
jgi:hypothetical protein